MQDLSTFFLSSFLVHCFCYYYYYFVVAVFSLVVNNKPRSESKLMLLNYLIAVVLVRLLLCLFCWFVLSLIWSFIFFSLLISVFDFSFWCAFSFFTCVWLKGMYVCAWVNAFGFSVHVCLSFIVSISFSVNTFFFWYDCKLL